MAGKWRQSDRTIACGGLSGQPALCARSACAAWRHVEWRIGCADDREYRQRFRFRIADPDRFERYRRLRFARERQCESPVGNGSRKFQADGLRCTDEKTTRTSDEPVVVEM